MRAVDSKQQDSEFDLYDERPRATTARRSRSQFSYARQSKRTTHYNGMHRRRRRRWNW
jgi:hypothetical protein